MNPAHNLSYILFRNSDHTQAGVINSFSSLYGYTEHARMMKSTTDNCK